MTAPLLAKRIAELDIEYQDYFRWLRRCRTPATVRHYYDNLMRAERLIDKKVTEATPVDFMNLLNTLMKHYGHGTAVITVQSVKSIVNFFVSNGTLKDSPLPGKFKVPNTPNKLNAFLSPHHIPAINTVLTKDIKSAKSTVRSIQADDNLLTMAYQKRFAVLLLIDTGCFLTELLRLNTNDICKTTVENRTVIQCRTYTSVLVSGTDEPGYIPLSQHTVKAFQDYINIAPEKVKQGLKPLVYAHKVTVEKWVRLLAKRLRDMGYYEVQTTNINQLRKLLEQKVAVSALNRNLNPQVVSKNLKGFLTYSLLNQELSARLADTLFDY